MTSSPASHGILRTSGWNGECVGPIFPRLSVVTFIFPCTTIPAATLLPFPESLETVGWNTIAISRDTPRRSSTTPADVAVRAEVGGSEPTLPVRWIARSNTDPWLCTRPAVGTKPVHSAGRPGPREISNLTTDARPRAQAERGKLGSQGSMRSSPEAATGEASSSPAFPFERKHSGCVGVISRKLHNYVA